MVNYNIRQRTNGVNKNARIDAKKKKKWNRKEIKKLD